MTANVKIFVDERPAAVKVPNSASASESQMKRPQPTRVKEGIQGGRKRINVSWLETGPAPKGRVWVVAAKASPSSGREDRHFRRSFTEVVGGEVSAGQEVIGVNQTRNLRPRGGGCSFRMSDLHQD
jgi:hypothetical protein